MVRALAYAAAYAAILLLSSPAAPDSIEITAGSTSLNWDGSLSGLTISSSDSRFQSDHRTAAVPAFAGGSTVDLSTTIPFTNGGNHPLAVTYRGQQFPEAWLSGSMTIAARTFVAPHVNGDGSTVQRFTTTFTMTGAVTAWPTSERTGTPLFSTRVNGGGTISAGPYRIVDDGYRLSAGGEVFSFTPAAAGVPVAVAATSDDPVLRSRAARSRAPRTSPASLEPVARRGVRGRTTPPA